jgi:hypothetical protein
MPYATPKVGANILQVTDRKQFTTIQLTNHRKKQPDNNQGFPTPCCIG